MAIRIEKPFGLSGDQTTVPTDATGTEVSFDTGWSPAYELAPTDAGYRYIDRAQHNYLWNVTTDNIKEWQEQTYPAFYTGISYPLAAIVRFGGKFYQAIIDGTTSSITDPSTSSEFELWDGAPALAPNRISVSQMVVEGTTGQPLPENGTLAPYAIGNEMALGWVVTEAVVDGTKDGDGNVTAASGKVRYTINKDEKGLIGVAQLFGSVMQSDGTGLTQVYADGSGITLGEDATSVWLEINFSQPTGFFYVAGISEQRGRLEVKSIFDASKSLQLSFGNLYQIQDQKTAGTSGGNSVSSAYVTRVLNAEVVNNISGASLLSNVITLPAGHYKIEASAPAYRVDRHRVALYNTSDSSFSIFGTSEYSGAATDPNTTSRSFLSGMIYIDSAKTFELRHYTEIIEPSGRGLGVECSDGNVEVYSEIKIWKVL